MDLFWEILITLWLSIDCVLINLLKNKFAVSISKFSFTERK